MEVNNHNDIALLYVLDESGNHAGICALLSDDINALREFRRKYRIPFDVDSMYMNAGPNDVVIGHYSPLSFRDVRELLYERYLQIGPFTIEVIQRQEDPLNSIENVFQDAMTEYFRHRLEETCEEFFELDGSSMSLPEQRIVIEKLSSYAVLGIDEFVDAKVFAHRIFSYDPELRKKVQQYLDNVHDTRAKEPHIDLLRSIEAHQALRSLETMEREMDVGADTGKIHGYYSMNTPRE